MFESNRYIFKNLLYLLFDIHSSPRKFTQVCALCGKLCPMPNSVIDHLLGGEGEGEMSEVKGAVGTRVKWR